jgi:Na+/H+ antiporter NhaD/arsenite permease-like protein
MVLLLALQPKRRKVRMNNAIPLMGVVLFLVAYAAITLEHKLELGKAGIALLAGALMWILVALHDPKNVQHHLKEVGADTFGIFIFLFLAMFLVEALTHYHLFDYIRKWLLERNFTERGQFFAVTAAAFGLSAVLDNLTTTIVMLQIACMFFRGTNLLVAACGIVVAANSGGAWSPIGDITTVMLWFGDKFQSYEVVKIGFFPALAHWVVAIGLLSRKIQQQGISDDDTSDVVPNLSRSEKLVIAVALGSFLLPLAASALRLPPYVGLLVGVGVVWVLIDVCKRSTSRQTHLDASIDALLKNADSPSMLFFAGILLTVGGLHALGVLDAVGHYVYGDAPSQKTLIAGNVTLGLLSAVIDNVPLVAIAMKILNVSEVGMWVLLALTAGTGGSLFVIGSASGVVAQGKVKGLTFAMYAKICFVPVLLGYAAMVVVWICQRALLGW